MKKVLAILTKVRCHIFRKGRMLMVALGLALLASGVLPVAGSVIPPSRKTWNY
jgi:hypothetical protein